MKRVIPAVVLLIVAAALTVYGSVYVSKTTSQLIGLLGAAQQRCNEGDYAGAQEALSDYCQEYRRNEPALLLFVRRDMLAELTRIAEPLFDYANQEMRYDFLTEIRRAVLQLEIIRESQFKLI